MKIYIFLSLALPLLISGCGDSPSHIEVVEDLPFSWSDNSQFLDFNLGDSVEQNRTSIDTIMDIEIRWNSTSSENKVSSFYGELSSNKSIELEYQELQDYYNDLFDTLGAELDTSAHWSYWNFELKKEHAELYMILLDSSLIEISASLVAYK